MSQVLHISQKDLRHLWPQIAVFAGLAAVFCWAESQLGGVYRGPAGELGRFGSQLAPLALWYLVATAVHHESLCDDGHYWVTRPIAGHRLLAAKALFVFTTINVPLLIVDCLILAAQGFSPTEHLPGLLFRQALFIMAWILPAAALAAVTKNLAQLALTGFALAGLAAAAESLLYRDTSSIWGFFEWVRSTAVTVVVFGGAGSVVLIQYLRRRTAVARAVVAAAVLLAAMVYIFAPWEAAFAVQAALSRHDVEDDLMTISFAAEAPLEPPSEFHHRLPFTTISIPVHVTGLPAGGESEVVAERTMIQIETRDGRSLQFSVRELSRAHTGDGIYWYSATTLETFSEREREGSARVRLSLYLTQYGIPRSTRVSANENPATLPDGTLCAPDLTSSPGHVFFACRSALGGSARTKVRLHHRASDAFRMSENRGWRSHSPFPAGITLSPIRRSSTSFLLDEEVMPGREPERAIWQVTPEECDVDFETWEPLAHFRRSFEIPRIKLGDYLR